MLSSTKAQQCDCYKIIEPNHPHQCNICKRNFSACLYINKLQHKITLQAIEIDQLKSEVKSCELEIRRQRLDIQTLNSKYVAGIEHVADIQHQKDLADRELEELSTRLFEEANNMVATEKRKKHQLEELLRYTEDQLSTEQSQLYELRNRIENTAALSPPPPYFDDFKKPMSDMMQYFHKSDSGLLHHNSIENNINSRLLFDQIRAQQSILLSKQTDDGTKTADDECQQVGLVSNRDSLVNINNNSNKTNKNADNLFGNNHQDGVLQLDIFRKFIEQEQRRRRNSSPSLISSGSSDDNEEEEETYSFFQYVRQHQQSEYITRCEIEDIEPCLQFGNSNSRMCVKIMMEHMSQAPCFIEPITTEEAKLIPSLFNAVTTAYYRPIWERLTATVSQQQQLQLECSACGKRRDATTKSCYYYRFRLDENEDWLLIDQNCRDRLVAVCNFYSFIRNIQMGYYNHQLPEDLYLENVQLRLKMFYSRMGNI